MAFPSTPGRAWPGDATPGTPGPALPSPPPSPGSGIFPAVPGQFMPGQAMPGQPLATSLPPPAGPYLIGLESDAAGSNTTVITAVNATGTGTGTVVAVCAPSATPSGVTDSAGNVYTLATSDAAGNEPTWVYVALNTTALAVGATITVTWSATTGTKNALAITAPGLKTASAVDQAAHADGASTTPAATSGTLTQASEFAVAVISNASGGGAVTWGGSWAGQGSAQNGTGPYTAIAVQTVSATTPVTATGTLGTSAAWTALVLTLELAPVPGVVQAVGGAVCNTYGIESVEMTSTPGNALVVLAGWNLADSSDGPMPACYVTDSAGPGNYWVHLGTSGAAGTGSRCAAWVCTNAQAVTWVSVGLTSFASSLAWTVVEISGMPAFTAKDVSVTTFTSSGNSVSLSAAAADADVAFGLVAAGSTAVSVSTPPAGWSSIFPVSAGTGLPGAQIAYPNWVKIFPYLLPNAAPGALSFSATLTGGTPPLSGLLVAIQSSPPTPQLSNPNYPLVKVEAGFGFQPGDPTQVPPTWTDITARAMSKEGDTWIAWSYGRQYELSTPEAGTLTIGVNNADGAFTPGNPASEYTGVALGNPVRVSAYWAGRWWHVAYGYIERIPQEWPDLPQWGLSKMVCTDGLAAMASTAMPSALDGDILLDGPYAYLPGSEQYYAFSTGFGSGTPGSAVSAGGAGNIPGVFSQIEAQGLPAANAARTNQKPGVYVDGSIATLQTGQTLNLNGDNGTGFGATSATGTQSRGPGMIYTDPGMPGPSNATGLSVEYWVIINDTTETTLFQAYQPPSPYVLGNFELRAFIGTNTLSVIFPNGTGWSVTFKPSASAQQIVFTISPAPNPALSLYVNGTLAAIQSFPSAYLTPWYAMALGCTRYAWGSGLGGPWVGNYTAAKLAIYPYPLPPARIYSHWITGSAGSSGDTFTQRMAKIMDWGYLSLPRGGPTTYQGSAGVVFQGMAYDLSGSNASDSANTAATGDGGYYVAMPDGTVTVIPRWWTYGLASQATFGDATTPGVEVPYLGDQAFDYDNTYVYNNSQASLTQGPNQGIVVVNKDFTSQDEYFTRSALQVQIETTSNYDAYDTSNWNLNTYAQPAIRVRGMTVDAASNPSSFPAVLGTTVGTVATVIRRPVGGAVISSTVMCQKVSGQIGPNTFKVAYQLSPYTLPAGEALILDVAGSNQVGTGAQPR